MSKFIQKLLIYFSLEQSGESTDQHCRLFHFHNMLVQRECVCQHLSYVFSVTPTLTGFSRRLFVPQYVYSGLFYFVYPEYVPCVSEIGWHYEVALWLSLKFKVFSGQIDSSCQTHSYIFY